ncbi:MAG: 2Fe-2S iron-sulfur cluster-binding protein [Candidatus Krumholzibacteriia bacterium]
MSVTITVNGKEYRAEEGRWLIDVLNEIGMEIPHFCYHPGLGPDGNCRMCQVEYVTERGSRLAISCNAPVTEGLNVVTDSAKVKGARAGVEEFLLLNHPLDCPICDKAGECTLQNYYMAHDMKNTRQQFNRFKKKKAIDIGPTMVLDQERCVLCDRCVRFLRDKAESEELHIAGRGHDAYLTPFPGREVTSPYSLNTVDLCPVGALTSKDFRFSTPTWFLKRTPSVCTTCARGCAIEVDSRDQTIHRLRPRHNPSVNDYWMCDEGRLSYKFVNTDRVTRAVVERGGERFECSLENAVAALRGLLGITDDGEGVRRVPVVMLASGTCTLEELYALKVLAAALPDGSLYVARHVPDGEQDNMLRRSDRHPNIKGAEMLGVPVVDLRGKDAAGPPAGVVLLAVGFDYGIGEALERFCGSFEKIAIVAARTSALVEKAHVLVPGLTFAEKEGLLVNFQGQVQEIVPALDNLWDRTPPWEVIASLAAALNRENRFDTMAALRTSLAGTEAAFSGVDLNAVGPTGVRLQAQAV